MEHSTQSYACSRKSLTLSTALQIRKTRVCEASQGLWFSTEYLLGSGTENSRALLYVTAESLPLKSQWLLNSIMVAAEEKSFCYLL